MKKKLILTRGIQGSGKSTWAKAWVAEDPEHRIRINNDDLRNMFGPYWVPTREDLVSSTKRDLAHTAMRYGYDIIIDNMNLNPKEIKYWEDIVNKYNNYVNNTDIIKPNWAQYQYEIEFKDFFIPLDECIRRDACRPNPIGEKVIRETWKRYKHFIQTSEVERYVNNLRLWDSGKPMCVVIDMDSTVCFNTSKRPWFGDGSTEAMIDDIPNHGVVELVKAQEYPVVVCTGRNKDQYKVTIEWLANQGITPVDCYMRENGDYRKGVEVKAELMNQILDKYNVLVVFEDCEPIVQKYREMGLTVLQPNKGL
jgi:predicted kinase